MRPVTAAAPASAGGRSPCKLASVLLQYPTVALFDGIGHAGGCRRPHLAPGSQGGAGPFLRWFAATPPTEAAQHYVETFDLRRRCALYLTYYRYGDTRKRGMAMLTFKSAYRAAGLQPCEDELPDYLPMVLDFAACPRAGRRCCALIAATWNCCAVRWSRLGRRMPTSSRRCARTCPAWAGVSWTWSAGPGRPRPPRKWAWSRSHRRSTWPGTR